MKKSKNKILHDRIWAIKEKFQSAGIKYFMPVLQQSFKKYRSDAQEAKVRNVWSLRSLDVKIISDLEEVAEKIV